MGATQAMNEDEARRLLRSAYPTPNVGQMTWRPWIDGPTALRRPRRALMAAIVAAAVAVVIAVPVGVTVALHRFPSGPTPSGQVRPGVACSLADGVTSAEFDRDFASKLNFAFPAEAQITDPDRISDLVSALCALQQQAPGVYHCPAVATPMAYMARLLDGNTVTHAVTIFADGCPLVYGLGGTGTRLVKDPRTWELIGLALGIPDASLQTFVGSTSPPPTVAASPTPAPVLVPEAISWTGAGGGRLTEAYGTCDEPYIGGIVLISTDVNGNVQFGVPTHAAGIVSVDAPSMMVNGGVSLHLNHPAGPYTLFLGVSGTVTYSSNGISGSIDAWLAPQSNVQTSPSVHITGTWRCGV